MPRDPRKPLDDMRRSAEFIETMAAGRTLDDYRADEVFRSAVERKFEIIGEALNRLRKIDPTLADQIPEQRSIVSFRNVLIHGYDVVDDAVVWKIILQDLPQLRQQVTAMILLLGGDS
jgi:uncharacterized protein with HEPN domain